LADFIAKKPGEGLSRGISPNKLEAVPQSKSHGTAPKKVTGALGLGVLSSGSYL